MSESMTRGIRVKVESEFIPERSDPQNGEFFFAYHVTIENRGDEPVQLLSRHWIITDGMGKEQEVRGPGVVGKQPRLRARRDVPIQQRLPAHDPDRLDVRQLPHGDRRWRDLRSRDRSLHVGDPRRAQLTSIGSRHA